MFLKKFLLVLLCTVGMIEIVSCKSNKNYSDEPKKTTGYEKQTQDLGSTVSSSGGSTTQSGSTMKLAKLYVLFISHGTDSKKTEVVCKASCNSNTISSSRKILNSVCKDAVFIPKYEFDLDSSVKKLLDNKKGTLVDAEDMAALEALYRRSDNILKDTTVKDSLGKYSDVCIISKANELYQIAQPASSSSSDWIAYSDSKTQATNQNSSDNRMWKDSNTRYFWTQPSFEKKTLEEALNYCDNLNYGNLKDWTLPTKSDIPLSKWLSFNVPNSTIIGWWVKTKVSNENNYYYLHATFNGYVFDQSIPQEIRYVMCINKTGT